MSSNDTRETRPRVLFVYYTHTKQAQRVCDAMAEVLRGRGCDVSQASIEFTDPHYAKNFKEFPFRHAVFGILPLLWPQLRRKTGQIRIPDAAREDDYDLVCFGSPTWFFTTAMAARWDRIYARVIPQLRTRRPCLHPCRRSRVREPRQGQRHRASSTRRC